jgi:hypothetical protein
MQRHDFDVVSFLFGMFFIGSAAFALAVGNELPEFDYRWIWPVVIIIAGIVVLASALFRKRPDADTEHDSVSDHDPIR